MRNTPFTATLALFFTCLWFCQMTYAQVKATITYSDKNRWKLAPSSQDRTLIVNDGVFHYVNHFEERSFVNENGWHVSVARNYYDWFFDTGSNTVTEQRTLKEKGFFSSSTTKLLSSWRAGIPWTITDETDSIVGYKVQKAITASDDSLAGRGIVIANGKTYDISRGDVIAWFAPDIPISAGPKGYYGLPGLILKIEYSRDHTLETVLKSIRWDEAPDITIPTEGVPTPRDVITVSDSKCKKWLKKRK